jgi:hypothetical protein
MMIGICSTLNRALEDYQEKHRELHAEYTKVTYGENDDLIFDYCMIVGFTSDLNWHTDHKIWWGLSDLEDHSYVELSLHWMDE